MYEKGVFLDKLGNHTTAIEYLERKALAINPHDVDALNKNLIIEEKTGYHFISFGQFEQKFKAIKADNVNSSLGSARDVFFGFDPRTRTVLWCMLITHALLYRCILEPL